MPVATEMEGVVYRAGLVARQMNLFEGMDARPKNPSESAYIDRILPMDLNHAQPFVELIPKFGFNQLVDGRSERPMSPDSIYAVAVMVKDWWNDHGTLPVILVGRKDIISRLGKRKYIKGGEDFGQPLGSTEYISLDVRGKASKNTISYKLSRDEWGRGIGSADQYWQAGKSSGFSLGKMWFMDLHRVPDGELRPTEDAEAGRPTFSMVLVDCSFPGTGIGGVNVYVPHRRNSGLEEELSKGTFPMHEKG